MFFCLRFKKNVAHQMICDKLLSTRMVSQSIGYYWLSSAGARFTGYQWQVHIYGETGVGTY